MLVMSTSILRAEAMLQYFGSSWNEIEKRIPELAERGYDSKMGARPLARLIDNEVKSPLSRRVLFGDLANGGRVTVDIVDDKLDFTVTELPKILTKAERKLLKAQQSLEEAEKNAEPENQIHQS